MTRPNPKTVALLTAGTFFGFFIFGFTDNLKGPTLPALLRDINLSYAEGGTVLLGAYIGFLVATLAGGVIADRAGKKAVILIAGACLGSGVIAYSSSSSFWLLTASMFVFGLGLGSLEIGSNTIIVDLHPDQKGRLLNLLSVFHGLGSMLAPLYAGYLLQAGLSWRVAYRWSLPFILLLFLYFLLVRYSHTRAPQAAGGNLSSLQRTAFKGPIAWFYALIALYVAAEIGLASWIVEYLQTVKGETVAASTQALSIFFGSIMVGRFVGSLLVERVGYLRILLLAALASAACIALGAYGPPGLAILLPLTGLFFSIIFPTITAAVSDLQPGNIGVTLGLLFTFAGLGGVIGPWLMGLVSDLAGIQVGFGITLVYSGLMPLLLLRLLVQKRASMRSGSIEQA